ncbi:uncharacterized protein J3D65DRAFT_146818 [Phyllosticta citribraziliensis]|uniref:Uncharacterized protein n=1 Tax=Phyllosticta citribraziliensis TaxID=989973 RepID=A0ABR1L732_9PEZI
MVSVMDSSTVLLSRLLPRCFPSESQPARQTPEPNASFILPRTARFSPCLQPPAYLQLARDQTLSLTYLLSTSHLHSISLQNTQSQPKTNDNNITQTLTMVFLQTSSEVMAMGPQRRRLQRGRLPSSPLLWAPRSCPAALLASQSVSNAVGQHVGHSRSLRCCRRWLLQRLVLSPDNHTVGGGSVAALLRLGTRGRGGGSLRGS